MRIRPLQRYTEEYPEDVEVIRTTFEEQYEPELQLWNCVFNRTVWYRAHDITLHYYVARTRPLQPQSMDEVADDEEGVYELHREQAESAWLRQILDREGLDREWRRLFADSLIAAREAEAARARAAEAARVDELMRAWEAEQDREMQEATNKKEEIDDYTVYW